jgi:hypothetical protein
VLQNIETCTSPSAATSVYVEEQALQQSCKLHKICHSSCSAQTTKQAMRPEVGDPSATQIVAGATTHVGAARLVAVEDK